MASKHFKYVILGGGVSAVSSLILYYLLITRLIACCLRGKIMKFWFDFCRDMQRESSQSLALCQENWQSYRKRLYVVANYSASFSIFPPLFFGGEFFLIIYQYLTCSIWIFITKWMLCLLQMLARCLTYCSLYFLFARATHVGTSTHWIIIIVSQMLIQIFFFFLYYLQ